MKPTFEQLDRPYFVYGTLRPAWSNSRTWERNGGIALYDGEVYVSGFQMIDHGVPYAVATGNPDDRVIGCIVVPSKDENDSEWTRIEMDQLEGHPEHYERIAVTVQTPGGPLWAWIYTPTTWTPTGRVEPTGDFANCPRWKPARR